MATTCGNVVAKQTPHCSMQQGVQTRSATVVMLCDKATPSLRTRVLAFVVLQKVQCCTVWLFVHSFMELSFPCQQCPATLDMLLNPPCCFSCLQFCTNKIRKQKSNHLFQTCSNQERGDAVQTFLSLRCIHRKAQVG